VTGIRHRNLLIRSAPTLKTHPLYSAAPLQRRHQG
jgi:hypothetical protein